MKFRRVTPLMSNFAALDAYTIMITSKLHRNLIETVIKLINCMLNKSSKMFNGYTFTSFDYARKVYAFYVEVKRPKQESKFLPEDDFTKPLKTIESSYNRQLAFGIKNTVAFGGSLFEMNLRADGVYMPVMIKTFSLVSKEFELMNILVIFEALGFVKKVDGKLTKKINVVQKGWDSKNEFFLLGVQIRVYMKQIMT
ncbi:hypothetical protein EDC94DRAFT_586419 [Helicostylum pulchrum]|nr:hypothetical protein EDC94DRAFT_586419 [Helicostylum pulchrum]